MYFCSIKYKTFSHFLSDENPLAVSSQTKSVQELGLFLQLFYPWFSKYVLAYENECSLRFFQFRPLYIWNIVL